VLAGRDQYRREFDLDAGQFLPREAVILPQLRWTIGATQIEDRLAAATDDVDVRGPVVVRIYLL